MARKPNYNFERKERERLKADKLAEKAEAKRQQRERDLLDAQGAQTQGSEAPEVESRPGDDRTDAPPEQH